MPGVFIRILPGCVPSDFSKTFIFEFSILLCFRTCLQTVWPQNMNKHTAGSRANIPVILKLLIRAVRHSTGTIPT